MNTNFLTPRTQGLTGCAPGTGPIRPLRPLMARLLGAATRHTWRTVLALLSAASALTFAPGAFAQAYPNKPITLVVPFAPGGFVHAVAMMLSDTMGPLLGQPLVVSNQPGANGNVAAGAVARAAPDGYTIFLPTVSILTINPHLYKNLTFSPLQDFVPSGRSLTPATSSWSAPTAASRL